MHKKEYRHLFGPLVSRRFGRSLGVDLVPFKVCTVSCVFCQLGATPAPTLKRAEYVPTDEVIDELKQWINDDGNADFISLAGSGEPTLHRDFGKIINTIRQQCNIPVALLSNGTLFTQKQVRNAALPADVVKLSLSAWDQLSFEKINRPAPHLVFERIIDGYKTFRQEFDGQLWLEVFIVPGVNDQINDTARIAALAAEIAPDRIHLNTAVRPTDTDWVTPASDEQLESLTQLFNPVAEIPHLPVATNRSTTEITPEALLSILRRHPASPELLARCFGVTASELEPQLQQLLRAGKISSSGTLCMTVTQKHGKNGPGS